MLYVGSNSFNKLLLPKIFPLLQNLKTVTGKSDEENLTQRYEELVRLRNRIVAATERLNEMHRRVESEIADMQTQNEKQNEKPKDETKK